MIINALVNARNALLVTAFLLGSLAATPALAQQAPETQPAQSAPARALDAETQRVLDQAQADLQAGKLPEAIRGFEAVIAKDFTNYSAHFGLGLALYRQGDVRGAVFEFTQLTAIDPKRFEGWFNLGVAQDRAGQLGEAAQAFGRAVEAGKALGLSVAELKPAYLGQARALRAQNQYDPAATVLRAALTDLPGDAEITALLGDSLVRANKPLEALPVLYEVLARDPANVDALSQVADIYAAQQLPQRAVRELDRGIESATDPKVKAQLWLKKSTLLQGREQQGALQEALKLDPSLWAAHYNLGVSRLREGNIRGALEAFQDAFAQNPDEPRVALGLANTHDRLGNSAESGRFAAIAAKGSQGGERLEALFLQGKSAYNQRRFPEAVEALATVTKEQAGRADAWFFLGIAQFNLKSFADAASSLERARALQPTNASTVANLGAALYSAGRLPDAERVLTEATTLDARNAVAWYNLGLALRSLGKQAEARRALQRSADLGYAPARDLLR
ncbi:MAG: tetratricopeptide repeat protein [Meiothermus sp.]|nr:tetratricopeptide repeat protein [Meiothermus sp.]